MSRSSATPPPSPFAHEYGEGIHLVGDALTSTLLAKLCHKDTVQPEANWLVVELYRTLVHAIVANEFPCDTMDIPTRMIDETPHGVWRGEVIRQTARVVVVAVARAGLVPSQLAYEFLNHVVAPSSVRQDHLILARSVDVDGRVTGAALHGSKIGGIVDGAMLLIPDPMGATGSTISKVVSHYRHDVYGRPAKVIALHLIVTPEYLRHVRDRHPEVVIYALRVDRGLSSADVLRETPGARWSEERGLTDHHYIVPGGGGLGEVLNNSYDS